MTKTPGFSFIIPTLNEEDNLPRLIKSIHANMAKQDYEIIVSDNGSKDATHTVAKDLGAHVIVDERATIGGLRNNGEKKTKYSILVFLDADIYLAGDWSTNLRQEIEKWPDNGLIVTGNTYLVPEPPSFIEKHWFSKLIKTNNNYINSGHLITTKTLYGLIDGFDERLRTGEDYDFCQRARAAGGKIEKSARLKAFHYGFPNTLKDFMVREAWHGLEDFKSLSRLVHSKTALLSIFNALLVASALFSSLVLRSPQLTALTLIAILCTSLAFSMFKFGPSVSKDLLLTAACSQLYLLGRIGGAIVRIRRPSARS